MIYMMNYLLLLLGIILSIIGLFFIIIYLNLFVIGYNFLEYVYFISRSIYSDLFFVGILLIILFFKRRGKWITITIFY